MVIACLGERVLEAEILVGKNIGKKILIKRINMTTTDKMKRRQFSIRLSYGMTVNKSLKNVEIYLPRLVFSHRQF